MWGRQKSRNRKEREGGCILGKKEDGEYEEDDIKKRGHNIPCTAEREREGPRPKRIE